MRLFDYNAIGFQGVVSGGTATVEIKLPSRGKLHAVELIFKSDNAGTVERRPKATMLTQLVSVELFSGTKRFREKTIAEVFEDVERFGKTVKDGVCRIAFSDMSRNVGNAQDATAFVLAKKAEGFGDTLTFKVKLGVCTLPELEARLIWEKIDNAQLEKMLTVRSKGKGGHTTQIITSERHTTVNITKIGRERITLSGEGRNPSWIHMRTTDCSLIEIYRGNEPLWRGPLVDFENELDEAEYNATTGVISFSPDALAMGRFADIYQYKGQDLHIDVTMDAANSFDMRIDEIGDVPR